ncbi:glycosyltransferase [candidate division KSB3 bacterium]|uniref:Glycosyltransferase n=1 Tax=candidate division KSB3 bacterium TaxID=2044937 RepID=A0A9D5Q782_9BACT|nr:glycosyltransferase [candidate division KSB3 bacterium]MBD3326173.1 glycosyltransferase [candidate division KSB3 bacterium]
MMGQMVRRIGRMKVSVTLCVLNGELYLEEQLRSIAQQTRVPDEVLIFDDGSTDATLEIVRTVSTETGLYCPITINETRLGVEQNFSRAMGQASGDVIFFCDCDDVWGPEKVEKMIAPFQDDPDVSLVYSDGYIAGPNLELSGHTLFNRRPHKQLADGDARDIDQRLRYGQAPGIKASAMAFSARVRDLAGPIPLGVVHDSWIAFFGYALGKVIAIPEPLYYYRRHEHTWGDSSTNDLIPGLIRKPRPNLETEPRDKAVFAQCAYDRCVALEHEMGGNNDFPPRFDELKVACQESIRTLQARKAVTSSSGRLTRLVKGVLYFLKGDYGAIKNPQARFHAFCQDIGVARRKKVIN